VINIFRDMNCLEVYNRNNETIEQCPITAQDDRCGLTKRLRRAECASAI